MHGGKFVRYNLYGSLFEVPCKYVPPLRPLGRGAYGLVWLVQLNKCQKLFFSFFWFSDVVLKCLIFADVVVLMIVGSKKGLSLTP